MDVLCQGPEGTTRLYWPLPPAPGTPPVPLHVSISAQFGGFNLFLNYAIGLPASWPGWLGPTSYCCLPGPHEGTLDLVNHWMCLRLLMVHVINALLGFHGTTPQSMRVLPALGSPLSCPTSWSNSVLAADTLNVHLKLCEVLTTLSTLDLVSSFRIIYTWKKHWIKY